MKRVCERSLKRDLVQIEDMCSMLIRTKASPEELYKAWKIKEDIQQQIKNAP